MVLWPIRLAGRPLPACVYAGAIAPFLRFDGPLPKQLYAIGGRQDERVLDTVEMFDTWRGRWAECPPMRSRRCGCSAAVLPGGELFAVGGYDERGAILGMSAAAGGLLGGELGSLYQQRTWPRLVPN